ncbi:unnamed protein product [Mytilus edulis]|uniref:Uncharacterized protein n=1 Tax=Mytilus edulis TaxID=6550 RepID=A0A8S3QZX3_MYTED|nr:unnamed protein product [Mytilus edulis]
MWSILTEIYGGGLPKRPTSLHSKFKELKQQIAEFTQTHCKFICEVQSYRGIPCEHSDVDINTVDDFFMSHDGNVTHRDTVSTEYFEQFVFSCEKSILSSYSLCRDLAKQVFVVMLSDLERVYKPEVPHSCPLAYGFTGYIFTTQQASNILWAVRKACRI